MSEQKFIKDIYNAITRGTNEDCKRLIRIVNNEYMKSYIIQYYAGIASKKILDYISAEKFFKNSIMINTLFTPPVFELAQFYISISRFSEAEKMLLEIFDKNSLDPMSASGEIIYNMMDNLKICEILGSEYFKSKNIAQHRKILWVYGKMISRLKGRGLLNYTDLEGWKNLCIGLGNAYMIYEPEKAHEFYVFGLKPWLSLSTIDNKDYDTLFGKSTEEKNMLLKLNKSLFQGLSLSAGYVLTPHDLVRAEWGKKLYPIPVDISDSPKKKWLGGKIRLGLMSPDFNKNAAGLFLTPILRDYSPEKLDVFCYYNNNSSDEFTRVFKRYHVSDWINIYNMTDSEVYNIMKKNHQLDILIDCIGCGVGNRLELLAMKPVDTIVSYMGFPDFSYVPAITHRISDMYCEKIEWIPPSDLVNNREKVVRLKNFFSCYSLFENVTLPDITNTKVVPNVVKVGILQKLSKWHPIVVSAWKEIFAKRQDFVVYIKEEYDDISLKLQKELINEIISDKTRIKYIPFSPTLEGYLEGIKELDFCLETYPYSGTTTTCSCLLMGVPVFTVEFGNRHVSHVTSGILRAMGNMDDYICTDFNSLIKRVCEWKKDVIHSGDIRNLFLKMMDSRQYMNDFYEGLVEIMTEEDDSEETEV